MNKLAERYGLQTNENTIKEIDLTKVENPFKGNFQEIYELVRDGKVKKLSNGGISVTMTDDIEEDNKLGYAFNRTYSGRVYDLMKYLDLAEMLVTSGVIPQEITGEGRTLKVRVLNDKYLDINGDEVEGPEADGERRDCCDRECECDCEEDLTEDYTFTIEDVDYKIVNNPVTSERDGRYHPMIARVDSEAISNRKEIARQYLREHGWTDDDFDGCNTGTLERYVYEDLSE